MKRNILMITLTLAMSVVALAQEPKPTYGAFGGKPDERGSTRLLFVNQEKRSIVGEFAINYGRPAWKKEYEDAAAFDKMTRGKTWRMGDNFWTVLDTNLPLKIAGKDIAPGMWYLGLHRSEDGSQWSLAFIDPAKARAAKIDPFQIGNATIDFKVPVTVEKPAETTARLTIMLDLPEGEPGERDDEDNLGEPASVGPDTGDVLIYLKKKKGSQSELLFVNLSLFMPRELYLP